MLEDNTSSATVYYMGEVGLSTIFLGFRQEIQLHHAAASLSYPTEDIYWPARRSMNWQ